MDTSQVKSLITDTLMWMDDCAPNLNVPFYSVNAVNLILGTIAVESDLAQFIEQVGGPALGVCQMEPGTHSDICNNFLHQKNSLEVLAQNMQPLMSARLRYDLMYSIVFCRLHYYRIRESIPATVETQAGYWKQYYNTHLGKGRVEDYLIKWNTYAII